MNGNKQTTIFPDKKYVSTWQLVTGSKNGIFITTPLGSCLAVIAYDAHVKTGGIAHIMLPGEALFAHKNVQNRYAKNALTNLINNLLRLGASISTIDICLVGGANVLKKQNESIAKNIVSYTVALLKQKNLNVRKTSLGGFERRSAMLNLNTGVVNYTVGDGPENILWKFSDRIE